MTRKSVIVPLLLAFGAAGVARGTLQEPGGSPSQSDLGYIPIAVLKKQWEYHPGPLMLDALNWVGPESMSDSEQRICEPDLAKIAQVENRRWKRIGRADVFARLIDASAWRQAGRIGSIWDFVVARAPLLKKGMPLKELSAEEVEMLASTTAQVPSAQRRILNRGEGEFKLFPYLVWTSSLGEEALRFSTSSPIRKNSEMPAGRPTWASERPLGVQSSEAIDFGDGRLISIRLLASMLNERGFVVRYDARLAESKLFLKGTFEVQELLQSLAEVAQTIPLFVQDRRNVAGTAQATYRDMAKSLLEEHGFPPALCERIENDGTLKATMQELMSFPRMKQGYEARWGNRNERLNVSVKIMLHMDTEETWVSTSPYTGIQQGVRGVFQLIVTPG